MDRSLKERTIGAIVLVAFAVLVVPVFLDGPSGDSETVTAVVTLPGQNDQPRKQQTIVLERDRTHPVPAPRPVDSSPKPETAVAKTVAPPATQTRKTPIPAAKVAAGNAAPKQAPVSRETAQPKPTEASLTGMWAVQLGSFSNRGNAEKLAADLRSDGYAAFLSQLGTSSGELHRVRIGPQKDRDAAESVAAKLGKTGLKGQVVPHP
jgi:DedD protein